MTTALPGASKRSYADLKELGSDGKIIAGGTALVIMMKQQLLQPSCVISLRNVAGLSDISENNGSVHIGGLVSHAHLDASDVVQGKLPVLGATYHHVATQRVRTMATVGGGLAHADPNQDPPPTFIALGASFELGSAGGTRSVAAEDFFSDYYETVLDPEEIVTGVSVPLMGGQQRRRLSQVPAALGRRLRHRQRRRGGHPRRRQVHHPGRPHRHGQRQHHARPGDGFRGRSQRAAGEGRGACAKPARRPRSTPTRSATSAARGPTRRRWPPCSSGGRWNRPSPTRPEQRRNRVKFSQSATVPAGREPLWQLLMDIPRVATCLPGVQDVEQVDGETYQGTLKVRVGPIALSLQGKIVLEEKDQDAWRAALRAEAEDRRVAGAMRGKSTMELKELSAEETELTVETDVNILGKIGEFGQPIIRKKADQMLNTFIDNIKKELAAN